MHDPLLGPLSYDEKLSWYISDAMPVPFLGGQLCRFVFDEYESDPRPEELGAAIQNALDAGPEVLVAAEPFVVQYCKDMLDAFGDDAPDVKLEKPGDVWSHVRFGDELHVSRRADGDAEDGVYLSLECNCDWEVEHGLQLVLLDGRVISKVGPYDGHLTYADAYDDPSLVGVVYKS